MAHVSPPCEHTMNHASSWSHDCRGCKCTEEYDRSTFDITVKIPAPTSLHPIESSEWPLESQFLRCKTVFFKKKWKICHDVLMRSLQLFVVRSMLHCFDLAVPRTSTNTWVVIIWILIHSIMSPFLIQSTATPSQNKYSRRYPCPMFDRPSYLKNL